MTVCIAALYGNGKGCVLASDQMTTAHFPIGYEFESTDIAKIIGIRESAYVLVAGNVLFADEVITEARQRLGSEGDTLTMSRIAECVRLAYQDVRKRHIIRHELEPRGLDIGFYYENQQKFAPAIVQMIDQQLRSWDPAVEFIVSGKDSSGCHIYTIQNPGDAIHHNSVGFVAIGNGGPHALYSMIEANYRKSLSKAEVEALVRAAKKRSEVAPGVGNETEIVSI